MSRWSLQFRTASSASVAHWSKSTCNTSSRPGTILRYLCGVASGSSKQAMIAPTGEGPERVISIEISHFRLCWSWTLYEVRRPGCVRWYSAGAANGLELMESSQGVGVGVRGHHKLLALRFQ